jgi:hypothetical protein
MGTIQKLSSQVIDYAERASEMADAAQGKHHQRPGLANRWLLLPASGAALYALLKSDAFSRPAKEVMGEAKARASELPDDLLTMVRQSTSGTSSRNGSSTSSSASAPPKSTHKSSPRKAGGARRRSSTRKTTASAR